MIVVGLSEFVVTAIAGIILLAVYLGENANGLNHPNPDVRTVARHFIATVIAGVLEAITFLLYSTVARHMSGWIFVAGYGISAVIMVQRLTLVIKARIRKRESTDDQPVVES